jgi:hypothetical protein
VIDSTVKVFHLIILKQFHNAPNSCHGIASASAAPTPPSSFDSAGKKREFIDQPVSFESAKRQKVEEGEEGRGAPKYQRRNSVS